MLYVCLQDSGAPSAASGLVQSSNGAFDRLANLLADLVLRVHLTSNAVRSHNMRYRLKLVGLQPWWLLRWCAPRFCERSVIL